jgi:hypothetical protein
MTPYTMLEIRIPYTMLWSRGQILSPWLEDKVDSGIVLPMVHVLESILELTLMWGYSQLRHRVPYTMFLFEYSLRIPYTMLWSELCEGAEICTMLGEENVRGNIYGNQELH